MKIIKILLPLLVIAAFAGGIYYYTILEEERMAQEAKIKEAQIALERKQAEEAAEQMKLNCAETDKYYIITKDHDNAIGEDILVKTKAEGVQMSCKYELAANDFEIKGEEAIYFKNLTETALLADIGTGPTGRKFRLYDMVDKKQIVEKEYFEELTVASNTLTYLGLSKTKADAKNCKEYATLMKDFGNANLVVQKAIDLKTYSVKEGKDTKCLAKQ